MANTDVLTTGQVARICRVAPRTVSKWFDRGQLRGYKIPGSRDRRIPLPNLLDFMKDHGIPLDAIENEAGVMLIVANAEHVEQLTRLARSGGSPIGSTNTIYAKSPVEAGAMLEKHHPGKVIIDRASFGADAERLSAEIQSGPTAPEVVIIDDIESLTSVAH